MAVPPLTTKNRIASTFSPATSGDIQQNFDKLFQWTQQVAAAINDYSTLPRSSAGLASGQLWVDTANGNVLKVVL